MCLHLINAITSVCSQLPCLCRTSSHPSFVDHVPLLFALLPPMSPLLTPLPPISDIIALSTAKIDKELCISILEEALQHLEKLQKTQSKNVKLVIIQGVLVLKFQAEV